MNTVKTISQVNETELKYGIVNSKGSWHNKYKDSCWIYAGGFRFEYSEGDLICVFSQYGEIVNINLIRDRFTGKSKGFCFICYEDQRSTVLAVDNFNGAKLGGRILKVDHVESYKLPDLYKDENDILKKFIYDKGCGPECEEEITRLQEESDKIKIQLDLEVDEYQERKKAREQRYNTIDDEKKPKREYLSPRRTENHRNRGNRSRSRSDHRKFKKEFSSSRSDHRRSRNDRSRSFDKSNKHNDHRENSSRSSHKKHSHGRSS